MSANINNQSALSKFSELFFARQTPSATAERHKGIAATIQDWMERRRAETELSNLSDRDLADIGLSRADIRTAVRFGINER
jgi:uncharacterized protein YjiS (DUF1127 family)